jgi:hypothetical protein
MRYPRRFPGGLLPLAAAAIALTSASTLPALAEHRNAPAGAFVSTHDIIVPGPPEVIFDAITGDVSAWWDHSFSDKPHRFYLEAKPGGGFYEIFDEAGNGVKHATVIYADRGKLLRFEGPLGLSGNAVNIVTSYVFIPVGEDSTRLHVEVHGAGEMDPSWPALVDQVWDHFIVQRFKPWVESGGHRKR